MLLGQQANGCTGSHHYPRLGHRVDMSATTNTTQSIQELRVLVLDDDEVMRYAMRRICNELGILAMVVGDTTDALNELAYRRPHRKYDVFITDIRLTYADVMQGDELVELVRKHHPKIKLVAMSSGMTPELERKLLPMGVDVCLGKPILTSDLLPIFESCL